MPVAGQSWKPVDKHPSLTGSNGAFRAGKLSSRMTESGRGYVKTKVDLAVNQFCKIQTSKSRRFEPRLEFLARFDQFAKVPGVFAQPRPIGGGGE
jgi:hypothetical protein